MPTILAPLQQTGGRAPGEGVPEHSEEFYRALIESSQNVIVVLDIDGTILFASPSVEYATGYLPSELAGRNAADIVHSDSQSDLKALLEQSVFGQRSVSHAPLISVRLKDGSFRYFEFTASILHGKSRPMGIVVTAHDATDLSAAGKALRRREEEYRGLFKHMIEGFAYCRMLYDARGVPEDWIYLDTNAAFELITGLANVSGRKVTEVIPGIQESNPELFEIYGRVARNGPPARFETKVESLGIWFDTSVFSPSPGHFVAIFEDITERKQSEARQREQQQLLDSIIATIPYSVFWKDRECNYLGCNSRFAREAGLQGPDEIAGKSDFELSWRENAELYRADDRAVMESGTPKLCYVEPQVRADGSKFWLETSKVPLQSSDGRIMGMLGIYTDITERKRAEEALRASEDRLTEAVTLARLGHWDYDVASDLFTLNDHVYALLRTTAEQAGGYTLSSAQYIERYVYPDDILIVREALRKAVENTDASYSSQLESRVTYADGATGCFDVRFITTKDATGRTVKISGAAQDITERKQAEESIRQSEEKFRRLVENLRDDYFFYRRDPKGTFSYVSPSIVNILGYSVDEFLTRYDEHVTGDLLNRAPESELTRGEQSVKQPLFEVEILDKFGMTRYLEVSETQVCDDAGAVIAVEGIAHDITVKKQVERTLLESREKEQFLADILGTSAQPFVVGYPDGRIGAMNSSFSELTGYPVMELQRIDWAKQLTPPDWWQREADALAELDRTGVPQRYEKEYIRKDGSRVLVEAFTHRALGPSGELSHYYSFVTDITDRKRAQKELARLAAAVEQTIDLVVITGVDGIIQYVNPAFERVTGYAREEVIGQTPRILKSGRQSEAFYHALWERILSGEVWSGRIMNRRKDGTLCDHDVTITPIRDETGAIINFVSVQRDVTQAMLLETQLRQAQKLEAVGSLAAGIAHEINTPIQFVGDNVRFFSEAFTALAGLLARIEVLKKDAENHPEMASCAREVAAAQEAADLDYLKDEIPKAIDQTLDGVARVAKIVRAMKDFSHPDQGQKGPADLNRALESTLTIARNELKYVADVVTDFDESLPSVWCYLGDLNQVFLNLLVNAAHAIAGVVGDGGNGKGTITVSTRRAESPSAPGESDGVVISISDTGTGIPEAIRDRVFEQFFTTKEVGQGTGQGLAIARAVVVDKHEGRIWFTTETGQGTAFHILLPIGAEDVMEVG